jgi:hypothetical protein
VDFSVDLNQVHKYLALKLWSFETPRVHENLISTEPPQLIVMPIRPESDIIFIQKEYSFLAHDVNLKIPEG